MIKQIVLFVYVFIALTGISISIRHHWQGASGSNNSMAKHNSRLAPIYSSEKLSSNK